MSVDDAIRIEASRYLGSRYAVLGGPEQPKVATASPWIPHGVVADHCAPSTVCSVFAAGVAIAAIPMARWSSQSWADLQIMDAARPWSPITALVAAGFREVDVPVAGSWHYCQGWHGLVDGRIVAGSGGHAWLWSPEGLILQASSSDGKVTWTDRAWLTQRERYSSGVRLVVLG